MLRAALIRLIYETCGVTTLTIDILRGLRLPQNGLLKIQPKGHFGPNFRRAVFHILCLRFKALSNHPYLVWRARTREPKCDRFPRNKNLREALDIF